MALTIKQLIHELSKIENQYLEVECYVTNAICASYDRTYELRKVHRLEKKVLLYTEDSDDDWIR